MKCLTVFLILILLNSCSKDPLGGDYEVLQGKWLWIEAEEIRKGKNGSGETSTTIPANEFENEYSLEFKQKGVLHFMKDGEREIKYRLKTSIFQEDYCSVFQNCDYIGLLLNNNDDQQMAIFLNSDTMDLACRNTNLPLNEYQDKSATYQYVYRFVRIN